MKRPSDHSTGSEGDSPEAKRFKLREGVVVHTSFREVHPDELHHSGGHRPKRLSNPQDQKNLLYVIIALIVALVILVILEVKQLQDRAEEKPVTSPPTQQDR